MFEFSVMRILRFRNVCSALSQSSHWLSIERRGLEYSTWKHGLVQLYNAAFLLSFVFFVTIACLI
jgi:hypothetical protein